MKIDLYIASRSSASYARLFHPTRGAVLIRNEDGLPVIEKWDADVVGFPQLSDQKIREVLAMPDPVQPELVKKECSRRILAVASQAAQINMAATLTAPGSTPADQTAYASWVGWVAAMRARCAALIAANDSTYTLDASWPACPADAAALAARH
jgi:hypothetical protein